MADLLPLAEAQRLVLEHARPLEAERVPIERASGRVLAGPAASTVDLPPFPSSAMDGYAVRAADVPGSLPVVGEAAAGRPFGRVLGAGEAVRISTGGVVPEGADAVAPVEVTDGGAESVVVREGVEPGDHVRGRGGDVQAGETVLEPGVLLGPAQVAGLAAAGVAEVRCTKRPRAAILVTGSELREPGTELREGEIYESNALLLASALGAAGAVPGQLGTVADDRGALERALERALPAFDLVITSGGASVGPHDLVREVQEGLRVEEVFWGVALKPGKPVAFGVRRGHLVFNLPGNPVSVLVTFELLVRPAVNALLGLADPLPRLSAGTLATSIRRNAARDEFVRARVRKTDDGPVLEPLVGQESHMIARSAGASALVAVEAGEGELPAGAAVRYLPL